MTQSVLITQWPAVVSSVPGGLAELHCYQNHTDYSYLYWYRQQGGRGFQLVVTIVVGSATAEEGFKTRFQAGTSGEKHWTLKISEVKKEDEAFYLCAASLHSDVGEPKSATKTHRKEAVY